MLAKAQEAGVYAKLHQVDGDGPVPEPATVDGPALVTVFRLLLNAPEDVRDRAIAFAAKVLPEADVGPAGRGEPRQPLVAAAPAAPLATAPTSGSPSCHHAEVEQLLARHGFEVVERRGFALCPAGAYRREWLRPVARRADDLAARSGRLSGVATDVLYVARRIPK